MPFVLLFALSFHGFFEGIAIGLSVNLFIKNDSISVMNLSIGVCLHKWAEALTLGLSFYKNKVNLYIKINRKQAIIMIICFSFVGPIGVILGEIMSSS